MLCQSKTVHVNCLVGKTHTYSVRFRWFVRYRDKSKHLRDIIYRIWRKRDVSVWWKDAKIEYVFATKNSQSRVCRLTQCSLFYLTQRASYTSFKSLLICDVIIKYDIDNETKLKSGILAHSKVTVWCTMLFLNINAMCSFEKRNTPFSLRSQRFFVMQDIAKWHK